MTTNFNQLPNFEYLLFVSEAYFSPSYHRTSSTVHYTSASTSHFELNYSAVIMHMYAGAPLRATDSLRPDEFIYHRGGRDVNGFTSLEPPVTVSAYDTMDGVGKSVVFRR